MLYLFDVCNQSIVLQLQMVSIWRMFGKCRQLEGIVSAAEDQVD